MRRTTPRLAKDLFNRKLASQRENQEDSEEELRPR